MALRPNNHITGDNAIRKIASDLIPEEWTISIPDSDYGLDMLIEVVRNNKTTGKLFFIQSKGTLDSSDEGNISYSMNLERIKDYSEIKIPVLLVYYSKTDGKFWGRWMNSLYSTLTKQQKKQDTITLHFSSSNIIDADYLRNIGDKILPSIANHVSIICTEASESFNRLHSQVIATAQSLVGDDISNDPRLSCMVVRLSYGGSLTDGFVDIKSDIYSIRISLRLESSDILYYPALSKEECPPWLLEIILTIALFGSTISSQAVDYVLLNPQKEALENIPINIWLSFLDQVQGKEIYKLSNLFDLAIQTKHEDIAQFIMLYVFMQVLKDIDCNELYRDLLSRYLNSELEEQTKGRLCYNLANSMRRIDYYEAFDLYVKAVHYEPEYRKLYYWWQEVGGVLYLTHHYYFAELFYKKARTLDPAKCREDIGLLISDCLVSQGKIKEALLEEVGYCEIHENLSSSVLLKTQITDMMNQRQIQVFDSIYWLNQGINYSCEGNHGESLNCFLIAWRLCDEGLEALVNAFIEALSVMDYVKMALIVSVLRDCAPEEGYKKIVSMLVSDNNIKPYTEETLDALKKLIFSKDLFSNR